jgi:hypothetical protein
MLIEHGGRVRIFDDSSIELQTEAGTTWYRSFTELERSLRRKNGLQPSEDVDTTGNGSEHGGDTGATSPTIPAQSVPSAAFLAPLQGKDAEPKRTLPTQNPVED